MIEVWEIIVSRQMHVAFSAFIEFDLSIGQKTTVIK